MYKYRNPETYYFLQTYNISHITSHFILNVIINANLWGGDTVLFALVLLVFCLKKRRVLETKKKKREKLGQK